MNGLATASAALFTLGVGLVQGGQGGGGFGGGGFGQGGGGFGGGGIGQGGQGQRLDRTIQGIDAAVHQYLDGEEIKSILTPGEFTEWPLTLKEGQVVIAEASSEAFDPALEVVDGNDKVLAENDDRFPGDQRPLLLWRCVKAGDYKVRGRCFRNKAGGQMALRMRIFNSVDLSKGPSVESTFEKNERFLFRLPMKAGQIRLLTDIHPNQNGYGRTNFLFAISPIGLPDIRLGSDIASLAQCLVMAPVDGDYYVLAQPYGPPNGKLRTKIEDLAARQLSRKQSAGTDRAPTEAPALWSVDVKAGEVLRASVSGLDLAAGLIVAERPDISDFDLKKPEKNPFFPKAKNEEEEKGPALMRLAGRARDGRIAVFGVKRDATLWLATNPRGGDKEFTLTVEPAAEEFGASKRLEGHLKIGYTDYWAFDAKVGEVMRFQSTASGFSGHVTLLGPEFGGRWVQIMNPDQTSCEGELIVQEPGRYLMAVSCLGDGGGGDYTVSREVYLPKEIHSGKPAAGQLEPGQVHVWKLTVNAGDPLLLKWKSSLWNYTISVRDETGAPAVIPMTEIDATNRYGILQAPGRKTYLIVLIPRGPKAEYTIEVNGLPGYKTTEKPSGG